MTGRMASGKSENVACILWKTDKVTEAEYMVEGSQIHTSTNGRLKLIKA